MSDWNQCFLNSFVGSAPRLELRVVDFHEIFTLPRDFLEEFVKRSRTANSFAATLPRTSVAGIRPILDASRPTAGIEKTW